MLRHSIEPDSDVAREHRRRHRLGVPARLACDTELRAFVEARLSTMTFKQIEAAVAENFAPDRRVSYSTIYRWWRGLNAGTQG